MKTVFILDGVVAGIVLVVSSEATAVAPAGADTAKVPDTVAVEVGWTATKQQDDSYVFAAAGQYGLLDPLDVYLAFKPEERIAIKASDNAEVKEFWSTYERLETARKPFDMNRSSVQQALTYFRELGILASDDRIDEISRGIPQ